MFKAVLVLQIEFTIRHLIEGDYAACSVVIALGATIGKVTPVHSMIIAFFQVILYAINRALIDISFQAVGTCFSRQCLLHRGHLLLK